jgi:restriction system protein
MSAAQNRLPNPFSLHCVAQSESQDGPVSSDVSYSSSTGWSIAHKLGDGRVFNRQQQYNMRDDRNRNGWEGPHRRNAGLTMTGTVVSNSGRYKYVERLYDDNRGGAQIIEIIEDCTPISGTKEIRTGSNDPHPTQNPSNQTAQISTPPATNSPTGSSAAPVPQKPKQALTTAIESQNLPDRPVTEPVKRTSPAGDTSPASGTPMPPQSAQSREYNPTPLIVLIGGAVLIWCTRNASNKRRTKMVCEAVDAAVNEHRRALVRKRFQTLRHDDYGKIDREPWDKEIRNFLVKVVDPAIRQLGSKEFDLYANMRDNFAQKISIKVEDQIGSSEGFTLGPNLSPTDYEQYCAQQLRTSGWSASTTKASGDQGTDIVAEKGAIRLVVQCKLYNRPVGNKAVQEIAAARAHEQADCAAVVSNSPYTPSAQQLANTNGVLLLHHSDLRNIDDLISA